MITMYNPYKKEYEEVMDNEITRTNPYYLFHEADGKRTPLPIAISYEIPEAIRFRDEWLRKNSSEAAEFCGYLNGNFHGGVPCR